MNLGTTIRVIEQIRKHTIVQRGALPAAIRTFTAANSTIRAAAVTDLKRNAFREPSARWASECVVLEAVAKHGDVYVASQPCSYHPLAHLLQCCFSL
jgi:hypothetical protein